MSPKLALQGCWVVVWSSGSCEHQFPINGGLSEARGLRAWTNSSVEAGIFRTGILEHLLPSLQPLPCKSPDRPSALCPGYLRCSTWRHW